MPCTVHPQRVRLNVTVTAVSAGYNHACALAADGTAYCWGNDSWGQLGRGTSGGPRGAGLVATSARFSQIVVGTRHTCGLTTDGVVWCWGFNDYGQLGLGTNDIGPHPVPIPIGSNLRFASLGRGPATNSCGVAVSGGVWCWGANHEESLGAPTTETCLSNDLRQFGDLCATRPLRALPDLALDRVTVGNGHACARATAGGEWICWGVAVNGNLGIGVPQDCVTVVGGMEYHVPCNRDRVPVIGGATFTEMHAGSTVTCGVDGERNAWCWGGPVPWGSLGTGVPEAMTNIPVRVAGSVAFTSLSVGGYNICGLDATGAVWCWGFNRTGAIGNGRFGEESVDVPTRVTAR